MLCKIETKTNFNKYFENIHLWGWYLYILFFDEDNNRECDTKQNQNWTLCPLSMFSIAYCNVFITEINVNLYHWVHILDFILDLRIGRNF